MGQILLKFIPDIFNKAWGTFSHPKFGPLAWMFCFTFWFVFFVVPIPIKDKTGFEVVVSTYYEIWRQDANATSLFIVGREAVKIELNCDRIEARIYRAQQNKWAIMASSMATQAKSIEIAKIDAGLREFEKKLEAAESDLLRATQSYETLIAER